MKNPLYIPFYLFHHETADAVEIRYRDLIRQDTRIRQELKTVSLIVFTHTVPGVIGVMYAAEYAQQSDEYEITLNLMGFKWDRTFQAPTIHAGKLKSVT